MHLIHRPTTRPIRIPPAPPLGNQSPTSTCLPLALLPLLILHSFLYVCNSHKHTHKNGHTHTHTHTHKHLEPRVHLPPCGTATAAAAGDNAQIPDR